MAALSAMTSTLQSTRQPPFWQLEPHHLRTPAGPCHHSLVLAGASVPTAGWVTRLDARRPAKRRFTLERPIDGSGCMHDDEAVPEHAAHNEPADGIGGVAEASFRGQG